MTDLVTELPSRERLEAADMFLSRFQETMEVAADSGVLDPEELHRLMGGLRDVVARVNTELLPELDLESGKEIGQRLISVLTLDTDELDPLEAADRYLMELEAIRHVFRDLLEENAPQALRKDACELIASVEGWLPGTSVADRAELFGMQLRQFQRRRSDEKPASPREQLITRLVAVLRHAWTDVGVVEWFRRPRPDLGGSRPLDLLQAGGHERELLMAARSGRVQGGV